MRDWLGQWSASKRVQGTARQCNAGKHCPCSCGCQCCCRPKSRTQETATRT
jgi:hypothetical protein